MANSRLPTSEKDHVHSLDALRSVLAAARAENNPPTPWRVLAARWPGVPAGTLCAISKGREPHKASVRAALGLPVTAPAPVCPVHGVVHAGRCPRRKTFEQAAADYDAWKARNMPKLLEIVAWAEGARR